MSRDWGAETAAQAARKDLRTPVQVKGYVDSLRADGLINVRVEGGDAVYPVAQDRRFGLLPVGAQVVMTYTLGQYTIVAVPGVQVAGPAGAATTPLRVVRSNDPWPADSGWVEASAVAFRVGADGVLEMYAQNAVAQPPPPTALESVTVHAVLSDNWDDDHSRWGGDEPKQGEWRGNGLRSGYWFLDPAQLAAVQGQAWSSFTLRVHRQSSGGNYQAVPVTMWTHAHATKPNGAPSRGNSADFGALSPDQVSEWTSSDPRWLDGFTSGSVLGFAAHRSDYVVFHPSASITFNP